MNDGQVFVAFFGWLWWDGRRKSFGLIMDDGVYGVFLGRVGWLVCIGMDWGWEGDRNRNGAQYHHHHWRLSFRHGYIRTTQKQLIHTLGGSCNWRLRSMELTSLRLLGMTALILKA